MEIPKCCGKDMKISMETGSFLEVQCQECGDVVFIKKGTQKAPELIDD